MNKYLILTFFIFVITACSGIFVGRVMFLVVVMVLVLTLQGLMKFYMRKILSHDEGVDYFY